MLMERFADAASLIPRGKAYATRINADFGKCDYAAAPSFYSGYMLYADIVNQYHLRKKHFGAILHPDFLSLRYVASGSQYVRCNGKTFLAESKDIMLIPPRCSYFYATGPEGYCFQRSITMKGCFMAQLLERLGLVGDFCITLSSAYFYFQMHDRLKGILKKGSLEDCEENQAICLFLLQKLANLHTRMDVPELLMRTRQYIEQNLDKPLSLEQISSVFKRSASTLNGLFRRHLATSIHQYIISRRMDNAYRMLRSGKYSVKEIAFLNGFSSLSNFSTEFRKYHGKNPRACQAGILM